MSYKKYAQQVQLLLDVLPHVITENCFALKGGTAIIRSPRLFSCASISGSWSRR